METSQLSPYRCYHCTFHGCFESVIYHSAFEMPTVSVRFIDRQIKIPNQTVWCTTIWITKSRKYISCDSFNETICIQASSDCSPFRKRQKNDCTTRIRQNLFGSTLENTCIGLDPCLQEKSKNTLTFLKPPLVYYFWTALGLYCFRSC